MNTTAPGNRPARSPAWSAAAVATRRTSILVVDDDPGIEDFIASALGPDEFRIISAEGVVAAMEALRSETPDLVLTALKLDDVPGWKLLELLRSDPAYQRVPVVILTVSDHVEDRQRSLRMGADRYLTKPATAKQVRKTVHELMVTRDELWLAMSLGSGESRRLRELLYDPTARVQTLASAVGILRSQIESGHTLCAWWIAFRPLFDVNGTLWDLLDQFRRKMVRGIEILISPVLGGDITVSVTHPGANDFQCFVEGKGPASLDSMADVERIVTSLVADTREEIGLDEQIVVFVGCAATSRQALYAPRLLYEAVRNAREGADDKRNRYFRELTVTLTEAIEKQKITTDFQALFELGTGKLYGFEACSRGPKGTEIERSSLLFDLAHEADLTWDLELRCIENVVPYIDEVCARGKLFFRLDASFIRQLHHRGVAALEPLLRCKDSVVVILAESTSCDLSILRDTQRDLERIGFSIALESCGGARLETLAELEPTYLKIGRALLQQIESDTVRRRLLQSLVHIATDVGAMTIAGTIETEAQRQACLELGVSVGQGSLFGNPSPWAELRSVGPSNEVIGSESGREGEK